MKSKRHESIFFESNNNSSMEDTKMEIIDLVSPDVSPQGLSNPIYISKTLRFDNYQRFSILPLFPMIDDQQSNTVHLLLANVPRNQLPQQNATLRYRDYTASFQITESSNCLNSFMVRMYEAYFQQILERLQVNVAILDYNYLRMKRCIELCHKTRSRIVNTSSINSTLNEHEWPKLLEFYLQMDVDLFYMKTCSYRDASPRSNKEGIFCNEPPECRYTMKPCNACWLCGTLYELTSRSQSPIEFGQYCAHRFVNGYQSILNAPATCETTNIIYVLTCPCQQYDFIGETNQTLGKRLIRHRELGNEIIHDYLIGKTHQTNTELSSKSRMRLYQHSIQCSTAMQMFLNCNSQYWCFVPMLENEANFNDEQYRLSTWLIERNDSNVQRRLQSIPKPPIGYRFSKQQLDQQYEYFVKRIDEKKPNFKLDLYNGKIIYLLPPNTSETFRQIVHSLFVTHTESKLNVLGHLFDDRIPPLVNNNYWCEGLVRPSERVESQHVQKKIRKTTTWE